MMMITYRNDAFELALLTNGKRFPRHSHDEFVISANLGGLEQVWLDGDTFVADTSMVTTYNPGQLQGSEHSHDRWQCASLYVQPQAFDDYFQQSLRFSRPACVSPRLARQLTQLVTAVMTPAQREEQIVMWLSELMTQTCGASVPLPIREPARIRRIKAQLASDLAEIPTLSELARQEGISAAHLVRGFTHSEGISPLAWLMQVRMRRARIWLRQGMPISQVALELGFADQAHFTKAFGRYNAMTPGQFRDIKF
ncbi:helix-turn-helix transcriptional regulator [Dickeya dadantii]|uniref:helix-turn-helix transcriptional regulator n=1 Tax=Dickeya dadantii TaxID=204038 RepID=UPI0021DB3DFA|nr:AraC family transcriptional regulator [Dickeya dadantii]